tara:strand:- start:2461 stop:2838 length:378 start_codon:yes stop_codon:yes gene_type:complete
MNGQKNLDNQGDYLQKENIDVETLIELKFNVEREISIMRETFEKLKEKRKYYNGNELDVYTVFRDYRNNVDNIGEVFYEKQTVLLSKIDNLLLNKCQHKWIDDVIDGPFSSQNYCYCCKCFLRKK